MYYRMRQIVILPLLFVLFFSGCVKNDNAVELGVIAPLTGPDADYGFYMRSGLELALEEINSKEGGKKIKLLFQDDQAQNNLALNAFKYLVDIKSVPLIFGPAMSGTSRALKDEANKKKVVLFSSISTNDLLKDAGEYYFRNISRNEFQVRTLADYFLANNLKSGAVLIENTPNGVNMATGFKEYFLKNGGTVELAEYYDERQTDFRTLISKIKSTNPGFILIAGGTVDALALITKQVRESGSTAYIATGDGFQGEAIIKIAGVSANGVLSTRPAVEDTSNSLYTSFVNRYQKKYGKYPGAYAVLSYDALMHVYKAMKNLDGEKISGEMLKNSLITTTYSGVNGEYKFDADGEVEKPYGIFSYENGKYIRVK